MGAAGVAVLLVGFLGVQLLDDQTPAQDVAGSSQAAGADPSPSASVTPSPSPSASAAPRQVLPVVRAATSADRTAATARTAFEHLLAGRALVTTRLLRATVRDDEVIAAAASDVLAGTAEDIAAVTRAYQGDALADELEPLLGEQAAGAVGYAQAVKDSDASAAEDAAAALDDSSTRLGAVLQRVTDGAVQAAEPVEDAAHLRAYVDAQARRDHAAAYAVEQDLQARAAALGGRLATTVAGPVAAGSATPQQQQLAVRWQLLFGQHAALAGDVVRAGLTSADDFDAATTALDANTAAMATAISGVVPPDQAQAFTTLWADQIDAMVAYAGATAESDPAGQSAARDRLAAAGQGLTSFFSAATGGRLADSALGPALERHSNALVGQAEAWAESDAATAYGLAAADYAGLAGLAAPAADAFAQTVAAAAPVGGAATGWGGAATAVGE